jgi:hypothetical protein
MRIVIAAAVVVVLLLAGMVGFVLQHQSNKQPAGALVATGSVGAKVETISHGEAVDIGKHLVEGQWTVVEFGGDW